MKNKDKQHHESTIGKIIYGFMLFAPLLAILSTCLIYAFNKEIETPSQNAEITYKYETNEVNNVNDLVVGNIYHFEIDSTDLVDSTFVFFYNDINIYNIEPIRMYETPNNRSTPYIYIYKSQDNRDHLGNLAEFRTETNALSYAFSSISCDLVFNGFDRSVGSNYEFFTICENVPIESVEITQNENPTEKVFYRAVDYVENSNLFNWAKNSVIYTGISETCTTLSINNTFIPMLLTYWLIMSVLYFLYDIILMILNILHKRIHAVQDSI